ncbi:MAG: biopolymer transporter ExbD [Pseudomonadota bacterium]
MLRRRRARLSMTSLIDVIFLLLLFFMLTSTFSRFGEIPMTLGGGGTQTVAEAPRLFLRVTDDGASLNGRSVDEAALAEAIRAEGDAPQVIVSASEDATAQGLATVLHALRGVQGARIVVLQ